MFKFKVGDKIITKEIINFEDMNIINVGVKGKVIHLDHTAQTTQPYMIEFETTNYPKYGNEWWAFENEIELTN